MEAQVKALDEHSERMLRGIHMDSVVTTITILDAANVAVATIKTSNLEVLATLFDRSNTEVQRYHLSSQPGGESCKTAMAAAGKH